MAVQMHMNSMGTPMHNMPPVMGMQPAYYGGPVPMVQQKPTIIQINKQNNNEIHCNFCQKQTGNLVEKRIGCAAIACAFIHIPFFGPFFFMVCLDDKYKDTDTICVVCRQLKHRVEGDICKK